VWNTLTLYIKIFIIFGYFGENGIYILLSKTGRLTGCLNKALDYTQMHTQKKHRFD